MLVGDDPGSSAYVDGKHRDCAEVGIASIRRELPEGACQAEVEAVVDELNVTRRAPDTSSSSRCPPGSTPTPC